MPIRTGSRGSWPNTGCPRGMGRHHFCRGVGKTGVGVDALLELILLQSEVLELKANPNKLATGRIVEARLDKGRGPIATVLISGGVLKTGDPFICGIHFGKVWSLYNDLGQKVNQALPSIPVEVHGFKMCFPRLEMNLLLLKMKKPPERSECSVSREKREAELPRPAKSPWRKLY